MKWLTTLWGIKKYLKKINYWINIVWCLILIIDLQPLSKRNVFVNRIGLSYGALPKGSNSRHPVIVYDRRHFHFFNGTLSTQILSILSFLCISFTLSIYIFHSFSHFLLSYSVPFFHITLFCILLYGLSLICECESWSINIHYCNYSILIYSFTLTLINFSLIFTQYIVFCEFVS